MFRCARTRQLAVGARCCLLKAQSVVLWWAQQEKDSNRRSVATSAKASAHLLVRDTSKSPRQHRDDGALFGGGCQGNRRCGCAHQTRPIPRGLKKAKINHCCPWQQCADSAATPFFWWLCAACGCARTCCDASSGYGHAARRPCGPSHGVCSGVCGEKKNLPR